MKNTLFIMLMIISLSLSAQRLDSTYIFPEIDMRIDNLGKERNYTDLFIVSGLAFLIASVATDNNSYLVPASVYMGTGFYLRVKSNNNLFRKRK
jgi:hypothetical protein